MEELSRAEKPEDQWKIIRKFQSVYIPDNRIRTIVKDYIKSMKKMEANTGKNLIIGAIMKKYNNNLNGAKVAQTVEDLL